MKAAEEARRIAWLDAARGIGIVLVVYGHAIRGQVAAHLYPDTAAIRLQDSIIYAFHMPLFFVISGLFATRGLAKGRAAFLRSRAIAIVYPYLLWSVLQLTLALMAIGYVNMPPSPAQFTTILWYPVGQFWFLYVLLLCQLVLLLPRSLFYMAVPAAMLVALTLRDTNMLTRACGYLPFFAAGVWITAPRLTGFLALRMRAISLLLVTVLIFTAGFLMRQLNAGPAYGVSLATAFAGLFAVFSAARLIASTSWGRPLEALGGASMPIFLSHVIAAAAVRILLAHAAPSFPPTITLLIVTVSGLGLPYLGYQAALRLGITPLLGFEANRRVAFTPEAVADAP